MLKYGVMRELIGWFPQRHGIEPHPKTKCDKNSTVEQAQQQASDRHKVTHQKKKKTFRPILSLDALLGASPLGHEAGCHFPVCGRFGRLPSLTSLCRQIPLQLVPEVRRAVIIRFGSFVNCISSIFRVQIGA